MEKEILFQKYFHAELSAEESIIFNDLLENNTEFTKEFEIRTVLFADKSVEIKTALQSLNQASLIDKLNDFISKFNVQSNELLEEKSKEILEVCKQFLKPQHPGPIVLMDEYSENNDFVLGIEAFKVGMYKVAIDQFVKLELSDDKSDDVFFYWGLSYLYLNPPNYTLAYFYLEKVLANDSSLKKEEAKWHLAICFINLGKVKEAFEIFDQIVLEKAWKFKEASVLLNLFISR